MVKRIKLSSGRSGGQPRSGGAIITGANLRPKKTSQLKRLTLEEQRALGIDTGPALIATPIRKTPTRELGRKP